MQSDYMSPEPDVLERAVHSEVDILSVCLRGAFRPLYLGFFQESWWGRDRGLSISWPPAAHGCWRSHLRRILLFARFPLKPSVDQAPSMLQGVFYG